jgi:hypothetical protein
VERDGRDNKERKIKRKKKLTNGLHLSFTYPTFNVFEPNKKWVGPIFTQPNRK